MVSLSLVQVFRLFICVCLTPTAKPHCSSFCIPLCLVCSLWRDGDCHGWCSWSRKILASMNDIMWSAVSCCNDTVLCSNDTVPYVVLCCNDTVLCVVSCCNDTVLSAVCCCCKCWTCILEQEDTRERVSVNDTVPCAMSCCNDTVHMTQCHVLCCALVTTQCRVLCRAVMTQCRVLLTQVSDSYPGAGRYSRAWTTFPQVYQDHEGNHPHSSRWTRLLHAMGQHMSHQISPSHGSCGSCAIMVPLTHTSIQCGLFCTAHGCAQHSHRHTHHVTCDVCSKRPHIWIVCRRCCLIIQITIRLLSLLVGLPGCGIQCSVFHWQLVEFDLHTHTHNRFTALLEFVWDHPGEQVPER